MAASLMLRNGAQAAEKAARKAALAYAVEGGMSAGLDYFPAQNSTPLVFGENRPVGGKLQDRTESNLTPAAAVDSFL
jgi:hypothetical protein